MLARASWLVWAFLDCHHLAIHHSQGPAKKAMVHSAGAEHVRKSVARAAASLLVCLSFVFGGATNAVTQYQLQVGGPDPIEPSDLAAAVDEPFGRTALAVTSGDVLSKWKDAVADIDTDSKMIARCRDTTTVCAAAAQEFLSIIADGRAHEGLARIGVINRAINMAVRPLSDVDNGVCSTGGARPL